MISDGCDESGKLRGHHWDAGLQVTGAIGS